MKDLDSLARENFVEWVSDAMSEAVQEGAVLIEIRFGAEWVKWPDLMSKFREAENLVRNDHPNFVAEAIISGVSPARAGAQDVIDSCLQAHKDGLAGIDFLPVPYEREADGESWRKIYSWGELASGVGLGITVHAGEFSTANIRSALGVPGLTRIGHATYAAYDSTLLSELAKARVTVECCLTSNVVLGAVSSLEEHPIRTFVDAGVPVTISSDDPVRLGATIGGEYHLATRLDLDASDLLKFTRNGIEASFTSEERKANLLANMP
ncbi:MAG: hypothetical protein OXI33_01955 [Chloroflexota bacterium]|nr:hypothetical protein [Chloroflexota bacterium]